MASAKGQGFFVFCPFFLLGALLKGGIDSVRQVSGESKLGYNPLGSANVCVAKNPASRGDQCRVHQERGESKPGETTD